MIKIIPMENKIKVEGNVKSISDYNELKNSIDQIVKSQKNIIVEFVDSMSLASSAIGYFTKLVNVDNVVLKLYVNDKQLFELLDDLGLIQVLNVQKM